MIAWFLSAWLEGALVLIGEVFGTWVRNDGDNGLTQLGAGPNCTFSWHWVC